MTVYEWLEQIEDLDKRKEEKLAEQEEIMALATNMTASLEGLPRGSGEVSDKVGNGAVRLIKWAEEVDEVIKDYEEKRKQAIQIIEKLPANEYQVIHRHYFLYKTFETIAEELDCSVRTVYRIRDSAVLSLQKVLKGVIECQYDNRV